MVRRLSYPAKLWGFVKSLKLAIILIITITVAVTADIMILAREWDPTPSSFARRAGEVYSHKWFLGLVFLLLLNLSACTIDGALRKIRSRNTSLGRWGSTVFHAGLIIILLGTLVTGNFRTFATIKLIQGEPKQVPFNALITKSDDYAPGGVMLGFTMLKQEKHTDTAGRVKNIDSWIDFSDGTAGFNNHKLADLEKFFYKGTYFFPSTYGYAVRLSVNGSEGQSVTDLTVPMETAEFSEGLKAYANSDFKIKELPYDFSFNFYPDMMNDRAKGNPYINYSELLGRPGMYVQAGLNGKTISQQIVRPGDIMNIEGYSIVFQEVKPWTKLVSVYDPGAKMVFWGILIALGGLTLFALLGNPKIKAFEKEH